MHSRPPNDALPPARWCITGCRMMYYRPQMTALPSLDTALPASDNALLALNDCIIGLGWCIQGCQMMHYQPPYDVLPATGWEDRWLEMVPEPPGASKTSETPSGRIRNWIWTCGAFGLFCWTLPLRKWESLCWRRRSFGGKWGSLILYFLFFRELLRLLHFCPMVADLEVFGCVRGELRQLEKEGFPSIVNIEMIKNNQKFWNKFIHFKVEN